MTSKDFRAWIEAIAGIAALAGLGLLVLEIRQNNELLRAQARAERAQIRLGAYDVILNNPQILDATQKSRNGEELSSVELSLLRTQAFQVLTRWQYVYGEYQEGLIDRDSLPIRNWRGVMANNKHIRQVWDNSSLDSFRPDFVEFINAEVVGQ